MALRLVDEFDTHPKLAELTETQRWRWITVLLHCARHHTGGQITAAALRRYRAPTTLLLQAGLLERGTGNHYQVHDWDVYNGETPHERVRAYLTNNPTASANLVHKNVGGKRELVLAAYKELAGTGNHQGTGTQPVPSRAGEPVPKRYQPVPSKEGTSSRDARPPASLRAGQGVALERCRRWLRSPVWDDVTPLESIGADLVQIAQRAGHELTETERDELEQLWREEREARFGVTSSPNGDEEAETA